MVTSRVTSEPARPVARAAVAKTRVERYVFSTMDDVAKHRIGDEVVQWGLHVWHTNADDLRGYYLERKSFETYLYVLRTLDGALVGSAALKTYRVDYQGQSIVVVKLGLGVDPAHRGNKFALRCLMTEMLRWKLRHPLQPLYLFSTLIHPVTYKLCCDLLGDRLYPHFAQPDHPERRAMAQFLAETFGVVKAESPHPFVYRELFSAIETEQASAYWRNNPRPEVQFYVAHCPDYYRSGDCLIGLGRVQLTHVLPMMLRTLVRNRIAQLRGRKARFT